MQLRQCEYCGASLDPQEICECRQISSAIYNIKTEEFEKITKENKDGQLEIEAEKLCCV